MNVGKERVSMNLARLKKGGTTFEVVIDPEQALAYKKGRLQEVRDALRDEHIYTDAKKGEVASPQEVEEQLGTQDLEAAAKIIKEGELQLTTSMREEQRAQKRRQIIQEVHRYGVDPRTGNPHPPQRIERAIEESRVKIDLNKSAQEQLKDIIDKLKPLLPIKLSTKRVRIHLPTTYASKAYGKVKTFGTLKKDEWKQDGSWEGELEIPGGLEADLYDLLNDLTSGHAEAQVIQ